MRSVRFWAIVNSSIVVLLIGAALFGDKGIVRHERLSEELSRTRALNEEIRQDNVRLHQEAEALRNDPEYVEFVIRDELGWMRADEMVFIVPTDDETQ